MPAGEYRDEDGYMYEIHTNGSVFATRVATSEPVFNPGTRRWVWKRFAAKLSGESKILPDAERDQVLIPWPKHDLNKPDGSEC